MVATGARRRPRLDARDGPALMPALNALMFGTLLYRARPVPRVIPALGLDPAHR